MKYQNVVPISQPAKICRKWFCIQKVSMEVTFQIATDSDHVGVILLEKLSQTHEISLKWDI